MPCVVLMGSSFAPCSVSTIRHRLLASQLIMMILLGYTSRALQPRIPAGSYQATTNGTSGIRWGETNEIVARRFPDAVQSGSLLNSGLRMNIPVHLDASETERTCGWKVQGYGSERGWPLS
jgi:hypothetical protein